MVRTSGDHLFPASVLFSLRRDTKEFRRAYVKRDLHLEHQPLVSAIFQLVLDCPLSQTSIALSKWPIHDDVLVATSRVPVDVSLERYDHFSTDFRLIGTLDVIIQGQDCRARVDPAWDSEELMSFHAQMGLERETIYVIYVVQV